MEKIHEKNPSKNPLKVSIGKTTMDPKPHWKQRNWFSELDAATQLNNCSSWPIFYHYHHHYHHHFYLVPMRS